MRPDKTSCSAEHFCTLNFIGYFYFMQIFIPLCMTQNCGLHYSNYVSSTFKVGQREWPVISGQRWHTSNYELVFPDSIWLLILVTFVSCKCLQHYVWLIIGDYTTVIILVAHLNWGKRERPLLSGHSVKLWINSHPGKYWRLTSSQLAG